MHLSELWFIPINIMINEPRHDCSYIAPIWFILLAASLLTGCSRQNKKGIEEPEGPVANTHFKAVSTENTNFVTGGQIFVPGYALVRGPGTVNLTTTLTIHNSDFKIPIIVTSVRCYDHTGKMIRDFIEESHSLEAMGSAEFILRPADSGANSAVNLIVDWKAEQLVNEPVVEAVMVGNLGTHGFAFVNSGRVINQSKEILQ
jgi:hypothetical protein